MFISPISPLNCKKPCKISFCVNPENVEKAAQKVADEISVEKPKTWLDKLLKGLFDVEPQNKDFDDTFAPGGSFDSDRINYP